jgi:trimethylamine:corrinoid methyltransferase-like protein
MALRLVGGIARRDEDVADLIEALVAAGEFLSHDHTRRYWREELSVASPVIDRESYGDWEATGSMSARQRAAREVDRRLAAAGDGRPDDGVDRALVRIMGAEATRCGCDGLPGDTAI